MSGKIFSVKPLCRDPHLTLGFKVKADDARRV
jgi:hypothetical protein